MPNLLHRKELKPLQNWLQRPNRKPLVLRGARQVGKSTLVRQLAATSGLHLIEVNFERNPEYQQAFTSNNPTEILSLLGVLLGQPVATNRSLLFFDEIQAAPEALLALRYFYEELPALPVIAAGSLLEFTLAEAAFPMPVGRIEYFHLGPMQFSDFLSAVGEQPLAGYLADIALPAIQNRTMPQAIHQKALARLRQFWLVGGLPEAVATFAQTQNYFEVSRIQQNIVATYRDDFNKYSHGNSNKRVRLVYDRLPVMVGQKFKYVNVSREYRSAEIEAALQQLCQAGVATRICHTSATGLPLAAQASQRHFKVLCLDVGLQTAALKLSLQDISAEELTLVNSGALAEQFTGQHLAYAAPEFQAPELHYWVREAKSAAAEVDYLLPVGSQIVPVEIKAGISGKLRSLHQFIKEKKQHLALRFNAAPPDLMHDTQRLTDGTTINYQLLSLPLYMVEQAMPLLRKIGNS